MGIMSIDRQAVQGIPDRHLVCMLAQALLEDWPPHTRLSQVLASTGVTVQSDLTIQELANAA